MKLKPQEIEIQNIDHLGIVAGIIDSIGLVIITYLPHPKLSHNENWSFGDLVLAIAYQYFLVLVQNTTLNGDKNQKKPIVTPGGAECGIIIL